MADTYAAARLRNQKRYRRAVERKCATMRAARARKREEGPPPERQEPVVERMVVCLFTWVDGKPYARMMQLDPISKASFRVTTAGKIMATRKGPVTSLSRATEILRKRAVRQKRFRVFTAAAPQPSP
jgi:hypothetical protein